MKKKDAPIHAIAVITCSQRTANEIQSQSIAKSYIDAVSPIYAQTIHWLIFPL